MKTCNTCHENKSLDRFEKTWSSYKGKQYVTIYYRNKCKDCKSKEVLEKYNLNRDVEVVKLRDRARRKRKEDPSIHRHNNILFKRHIKLATPNWVDKQALKQIYDKRPVGYDVDHIVPLRGKLVSGLHVPWNLQYMLSDENRNTKRNKLEYNAPTSALQAYFKKA